MKGRLLLWIPLALFLGFIVFAGLMLQRPDTQQIVTSKLIGKPLPAFSLPPAASDRPGLDSAVPVDGKPRLLNIFASWCVPCAAEAPQLTQLARAGVAIDAVAIRDARADVDRFLSRYGNPYTRIGLDARSVVQLSLGSSGVPETFVIDGKGIIRYQHIGDIREEHVPILLAELEKAR